MRRPLLVQILILVLTVCIIPFKLFADSVPDCVSSEASELLSDSQKSSSKLMLRVGKLALVEPTAYNEDFKAKDADVARGYVPFTRSWLKITYYNYKPSASELNVLPISVLAAPGQYSPVVFHVLPLLDSKVTVKISDFSGKEGKIPASALKAGWVRHLLKTTNEGMAKVSPEMIEEGNIVPLEKDVARTIWCTLKTPEEAKAGIYEGELSLSNTKGEYKVKVSVEVLPYKLQTKKSFGFGWYGMPLEDNLLADCVEHGFNAIDNGLLPAAKYSGGTVTCDFSGPEKRYQQLKKFNLLDCTHQGMTLGFATDLMHKNSLTEYSPEFNKAFKDYLAQCVKWNTEKKLKVAFWLVDEPREIMLADWNRTYADTVKYIKLAKEVPGSISLVDPMGDAEGKVDYTGFIDLLDVLVTHSWSGSKKMMTNTGKPGKAVLWVYNSGKTRTSFGFYPWKYNAQGRIEWAYAWGLDEKNALNCNSVSVYNGADTMTGVIFPLKDHLRSSPVWEIDRAGVDDYRYIYTLEQTIISAEKSGKSAAAAEAKKAKALLDGIKNKVVEYTDDINKTGVDGSEEVLNQWREQIARETVTLFNLSN